MPNNRNPLTLRLIPWLLSFLLSIPLMTNAADLNLNGDGVALSGYDPVSYFMSAPKKGYPALKATYEGANYYFENEENRVAFLANPEKYAPAYGGWCAWAMLDGDKVEVDPLSYKIVEGRNLLFYNGFWGDTRKKWNSKIQQTQESALVNQADQNWQKLQ